MYAQNICHLQNVLSIFKANITKILQQYYICIKNKK